MSHGCELYLIILHDKSRLSLLGLSSLLSKKSRTSQMAISKQSSTSLSIPVTSLAVSHQSSNIAVCSLRDVTIVMIKNGSFGRQFSLNLNYPPSSFITSIVWAPNSPTVLAVVSNDNVKIYDFSRDTISPIYNFKLLVGSFVDASFMFDKNQLYLITLTCEGACFVQTLDDSCIASQHGEIYLVDELHMENVDDSIVSGNGVCLHYSLPSETLFITLQTEPQTYKSFAYSNVVLRSTDDENSRNTACNGIYLKPYTPKTTSNSDSSKQKSKKFKASLKKTEEKSPNAEKKLSFMRNFADVRGHPGLVTANFGAHIAVITMQETTINLEILHDKRSVLDVVGTCHNFRDESKIQTSLLAVSEDGALRGWILTSEKEAETHLWRNIMVENNQTKKIKLEDENDEKFPINFFESCQHVNEVEFSSPQLARIYNKTQLKQRLAPSNSISQTQYVAWRGGFSINIKTTRGDLIRGVRIHVGQNGSEVVPPSVSFGNRKFAFVDINRAKWVDIVFTAKETLEFNGKVTMNFAASTHQEQRVIIEAIKVFSQPRRTVESGANAAASKTRSKKIVRTGPQSLEDIVNSKLVECYAVCSNLITKQSKRTENLEKIWNYLDHERASLGSLQSCAQLLPQNVDFSQKRDILVSNTFDLDSEYDWASLSNIIYKIFTIGKYRTATFRLYMTSDSSLQFFEKMATEFERLRCDEQNNPNRSIIYPRCSNYRELSYQLVFIICLANLINPSKSRCRIIYKFLNYNEKHIEFGARDAVFEAFLATEQLNKLNEKLNLSFPAGDNDEDVDPVDKEAPVERGASFEDALEGDEEDDVSEDNDSDEDDEDEDEDEDDDFGDHDPTEEEIIQQLESDANGGSVVISMPDMQALSNLIPGLDEQQIQQMMQIDDNPAALRDAIDFAFAMSQSREVESANPPTRSHQASTSEEQRAPIPEPATPVIDVIFSDDRLRLFRLDLVKTILEEPEPMPVVFHQILILLSSKLDPEELDEAELFESILTFLVKNIKTEVKEAKFISLLTLSHIMSSNDQIGKFVAEIVAPLLDSVLISFVMENCNAFANHVAIETGQDELTTKSAELDLKQRDLYPFGENQVRLTNGNKLLLFITSLQYMELVKTNTSGELPSSLVNAIFGLLVCDVLPPGLRLFAKKLAVTLVSSPEKYRSRRDQQTLTKYLESIEKIHRATVECSYHDIAEIFENFKSIIEIAKKRIHSWQKFAESEKWIAELLLNLSLKVECCNKEILQLIEMAITRNNQPTQDKEGL